MTNPLAATLERGKERRTDTDAKTSRRRFASVDVRGNRRAAIPDASRHRIHRMARRELAQTFLRRSKDARAKLRVRRRVLRSSRARLATSSWTCPKGGIRPFPRPVCPPFGTPFSSGAEGTDPVSFRLRKGTLLRSKGHVFPFTSHETVPPSGSSQKGRPSRHLEISLPRSRSWIDISWKDIDP